MFARKQDLCMLLRGMFYDQVFRVNVNGIKTHLLLINKLYVNLNKKLTK